MVDADETCRDMECRDASHYWNVDMAADKSFSHPLWREESRSLYGVLVLLLSSLCNNVQVAWLAHGAAKDVV